MIGLMQTQAEKMDKMIAFLNDLPAETYWAARLPSPEDEHIAQCCEAWRRFSTEERRAFTSMLKQNGRWILGIFSTRAAMLGVRQKSDRWLVYGIIALAALLGRSYADWREVLMDLSLLYHSAQKVGDPHVIFEEGAQYVDEERSRQLILGYLERKPPDQRIEVIGWEEVEGPSGVIYRFDQQPIPEGHL